MLRNIIIRFLFILNKFLPKNKEKVILISSSFSFWNMNIFLKQIQDINSKKIILISKKIEYSKDNYLLESFYWIYHCLTSKYVFTSHHVPAFLNKKNQEIVSFSHGIPLLYNKNIWSNILFGLKNLRYQTSFSLFMNDLYRIAYSSPDVEFLLSWDPLFDFYNDPQRYISVDEKNIIEEFTSTKKKIILYTPKNYSHAHVPFEQQTRTINQIIKEFLWELKENDSIIYILSLHPNDDELSKSNKDIISLREDVFINPISSERILPFCDIHISDCSSMIFQSLYLKKDIYIYFPDIELFESSGFLTTKIGNIIPEKYIYDNFLEIYKLIAEEEYDVWAIETRHKLIFWDKKIEISKDIYKTIIWKK